MYSWYRLNGFCQKKIIKNKRFCNAEGRLHLLQKDVCVKDEHYLDLQYLPTNRVWGLQGWGRCYRRRSMYAGALGFVLLVGRTSAQQTGTNYRVLCCFRAPPARARAASCSCIPVRAAWLEIQEKCFWHIFLPYSLILLFLSCLLPILVLPLPFFVMKRKFPAPVPSILTKCLFDIITSCQSLPQFSTKHISLFINLQFQFPRARTNDVLTLLHSTLDNWNNLV